MDPHTIDAFSKWLTLIGTLASAAALLVNLYIGRQLTQHRLDIEIRLMDERQHSDNIYVRRELHDSLADRVERVETT